MSDVTFAALEDAIAAHVADECDDDMTAGWVVVAETTNLGELDDGVSSFYTVTRDGQSNFLTSGLLLRSLEAGRMGDGDV